MRVGSRKPCEPLPIGTDGLKRDRWTRSPPAKGLHGRLRSHYQGRWSGDRFSVYVRDRYVLLDLTEKKRTAIGAGELSVDEKIRDCVRAHLGFR